MSKKVKQKQNQKRVPKEVGGEEEALTSYARALHRIQSEMGNDITYSFQLNQKGKQLFGGLFSGVYAYDTIPTLQNNHCCLFNLDKSNQPGTHWCSLYKSGSTNYVYDSFGRKVLKGLGYVNSDLDAEQGVKENNCGQRSLAWLVVVYALGINKAKKI